MFPGTAVRAGLGPLVAALFALLFLAFLAPSASTAFARDERAAHHERTPAGGTAGPLRTRDRQRADDGAPEPSVRPATGQEPPAAHEAAAPCPAPCPGPRPAHSRTPAALQVFRH
ncbi:hypothetical protein ABZ858_12220 [Streptomyces sp. NPDC047017]|uniref:hypothetical protein n=1 Tax=Streptomyces sp. NPDC047017 TaxID=3155024 RepID=UPI00340A0F2B